MASSNSNKNRSVPRRPIKCTHPKCGKYGHYTSQCWHARPKLRPRGQNSQDNCGLGRGWDIPNDESNELTNGNPSWLDDSTGMSDALSPDPFPLFKLPQEIQDKIYEYVYEDKHGVGVRMSYFGGEVYPEVTVRGWYYGGLALVSKKVRQDSQRARKQAFNGRMRVAWDNESYGLAFTRICAPSWSHLRHRITELAISGLSGRTADSGISAVWRAIPNYFPQVTLINIRFDCYRYMLAERDNPYVLTTDWLRVMDENYPKDFALGRMDRDFTYPSGILELPNLVRAMEDASRPCTIFLKTTMNWLNSNQCREVKQYIKFLVTTNRLEAVERVFG